MCSCSLPYATTITCLTRWWAVLWDLNREENFWWSLFACWWPNSLNHLLDVAEQGVGRGYGEESSPPSLAAGNVQNPQTREKYLLLKEKYSTALMTHSPFPVARWWEEGKCWEHTSAISELRIQRALPNAEICRKNYSKLQYSTQIQLLNKADSW